MTAAARLCPMCGKPRDHAPRQRGGSATENPHAPFCSTRCKDRDLVRWFSDGYSVPGAPADPEEIDRSLD